MRLPSNFTEEASKMIVLREGSSKFYRRSFQNERFVRRSLQISKEKLPKMIISCEASFKFQKRSFQNECFVKMGVSCEASFKFHRRNFQKLCPNFTEKCSKMIVPCEASSKFHRRSFRNTIVHTPTLSLQSYYFMVVTIINGSDCFNDSILYSH